MKSEVINWWGANDTEGFRFFPRAASTVANQVDAIYSTWVGISVIMTAAIFAVVIFFCWYYGKDRVAARGNYQGSTEHGSGLLLEITWSVIPLIISWAMGTWAAQVYVDMYTPAPNAMNIYVVAKQWMWKFQHPTGPREINELHVPVGRSIRVILATQDVIHSFYVPAFRIKQDAVPGRYTEISFEATEVGDYDLYCAEYCGTHHSRMRAHVVVMKPDEYESWLAGGSSGGVKVGEGGMAAAGAQLFQNKGCVSCHAAPGQIGPKLEGVVGSEVKLENGSTVLADENYIRESILNPLSKIVQGFKPLMPAYQGQLTEEETLQLVEYIKSLKKTNTEEAIKP